MKKTDLYAIMPRGCNYGWGVCGRYLAFELSQVRKVGYVCETFGPQDIGDREQYEALSEVWISKDNWGEKGDEQGLVALDAPAIQAIRGQDLRPLTMNVKSPFTVGYTFFETPFLRSEDVAFANGYYDVVVGGSRWCEQVLSENGVKNTATIIQGVDGNVFHDHVGDKEYFRDKFVVFSGGKFELRKGQDLVIRAFKVLQDRHDDVVLVNCWFNPWEGSLITMASSPYISCEKPNGNYLSYINQTLYRNGIDLEKVVTLPPTAQREMANVIRNTDCGLFPNRCEGGTNLVLMEYMACGKPAIASYSSGHRDIMSSNNCIPLVSMKEFKMVAPDGVLMNQWDDPDLEEIVEKLEWAYQHPDQIGEIGDSAGESMKDVTWGSAATAFLRLLGSN